MAQTIKQTRVLKVEFLAEDSDTALTWSLNNPTNGVSRAAVVSAAAYFFADSNSSGYNLLKRDSVGAPPAVGLGKIQTVETNIITTDLE